MSTVNQQLACYTSTAAALQAFGAANRANFSTAGLVQTADTGQVNWATVTPPANNVYIGYEMWRLNDALQASAPIFIKLRYFRGSAYYDSGQPTVYISVGTGTDGAGNLTGATQVGELQQSSQGSSTTAVPCYWAGDGTYFWFLWGATNGGNGANYTPFAFFMIDRTRNAAGAATAEGFVVIRSSYNVLGYSSNGFAAAPTNVTFGGTSGSQMTSWRESLVFFDRYQVSERNNYCVSVIPGDGFSSGTYGSDTTIYPLLMQSGKQTFFNAMMVGFNNDFSSLTPIVAPSLGGNHTYLPLKFTPTGLSTHCMLLRYE